MKDLPFPAISIVNTHYS